MKAHFVETDDFNTLFLDGKLAIAEHSLVASDVAKLILGKENVTREYVEDSDEYMDRVAELQSTSGEGV